MRKTVASLQDPLMLTTAAVPSLTKAARPVRGQQQLGREWRPIFGRL